MFVDETEAEAYVAEDPAAFALLLWGQRLRGLRVNLAVADDGRLQELIEESWRARPRSGCSPNATAGSSGKSAHAPRRRPPGDAA